MKNLIRISLFTAFIFAFGISKAQEFKQAVKSANQIVITKMLGKINISEGEGNELTIVTRDFPTIPEKAKGLKPISAAGTTDNTGIGLEIKEESGKIALQTGEFPFLVKYFQMGGGKMLRVSWEGPGFKKKDITAETLFHKVEK